MEMLPGDTVFRFGAAGTAVLPISGIQVRKSVAAERLLSSTGTLLPGGTGRYYAGSWQSCLVTGVSNPGYVLCILDNFVASATFSIDYAFTSNQKTQNIAADSYVMFQTTRVRMQLKNSLGISLDPGSARYYSGAWRDVGNTSGGEVASELLPGNYSFAMTYGSAQQQKTQNVATNPIVLFQTVNVALEMRNSGNALIDTGTTQYYAGSWLNFGATSGGLVTRELLPVSYSFRMTYEGSQSQITQNVATNSVVVFQTTPVVLRLIDSQGNFLDSGSAQYYAGSWLPFGSTSGGQVTKELLAGTFSFNMTFNYGIQQKTQNIGADPIVVFQTGRVNSTTLTCSGYYAVCRHLLSYQYCYPLISTQWKVR